MDDLTRLPTRYGEPVLWRDAEDRAYWTDGSRVTDRELQAAPGTVLRDILVHSGLTVLATNEQGVDYEEHPCADPCEYDGCTRHDKPKEV